MQWNSITIASRAADVFTPSAAPKFALLFLHPHGDETLAHPAAKFLPALAEAGLACCCPHASRTWWSDKVLPSFDAAQSAERYLLDDVVPWMRATWSLPERAIAIAGISMGGQGAMRLGFKYPDRIPVVAGIASAVDYHLAFDELDELPQMYRSRERCRQDTVTLHAGGRDSPRHVWFACDPEDQAWHSGNDRLHEKLNAVGVPHTADLTTSGGGHSWDYFNAMAQPMIDFVVAALGKESRRLM